MVFGFVKNFCSPVSLSAVSKREYDENEVDPYHGKQDKLPEPEALDLPDDLKLDSEDKTGGEDTDSEEAEGTSSRAPIARSPWHWAARIPFWPVL